MRREALRLSVRSLTRRPAESLLLVVSVALAVGAASAGITLAGAGTTISGRLLSSLRYREIVVSNGIERRDKARDMKLPARPTLPNNVVLTVDDLHRARLVSPAVQYAYLAETDRWPLTETPRRHSDVVHGMTVNPGYFAVRNLTPAAGRLLTDADVAGGESVMVLGAELGATMFDDGAPVGRTFWAEGQPYRIVGVLARSFTSVDRQAFAPPGVANDRLTIHFQARSLRFTVADRRSLEAAGEQLTQYFDAAYGAGILHVTDPSAEARLIAGRFRGVVRAVLFLSVSVLMVSALYLANIFAGRALRKRRSAGILKAMGATAGGVFAVFAVEAAVIAAIGAAAGLGVAAFLAVLILVTGGVGLLSLMMVEVLSRSRQIALSRAFGASKRSIAAEFLVWSVVMAAAAAALGVVLSLFLSAPLTQLVTAVFRDTAEIDLTGPVITPAAVAAGVAAAVGIGGLLGPLPVFSALAAPIAEGIRDA